MAWLPPTSLTVDPARWDMNCCAGGGIILSSVTSRYQVGLVFHAGVLTAPLRASNPHGTCEFAMKSAFSDGTSPAKLSANFALSNMRKPSTGGRIGGTGAPGGGFAISVPTDSPASGAKAVM